MGALSDQFLRETLLPNLRREAGLLVAYAGRAGDGEHGERGERVVASIWDPPTTTEEASALLGTAFDFELGQEISEPSIELLEMIVGLPFEQPEDPQILRIFRGQARPAELEAYVADAKGGTYADVAARYGPAAVFLGVQPPDRWLTVSVWTSWDSLAAATGGDLRNPIATRDSERPLSGNALHYEIVPNTGAGARPAAREDG